MRSNRKPFTDPSSYGFPTRRHILDKRSVEDKGV
jgi:hypothetical protein